MLWIRIGFNADPDTDPAFYLNADPDPDPGSQTNADPCRSGSWTDLKVKRVEFFRTKYIVHKVSNKSKNIPTNVQKPF